RRVDLPEPERREMSPNDLGQSMAQLEIALQLLAAQVEVAVAQSKVLGRELLPRTTRNEDRGRGGLRENGEAGNPNLDPARGHVGVHHALRALVHVALDLDHPLRGQVWGALQYIRGRPVRAE